MDLDLREHAIRGIEAELAELRAREQLLEDRLATLRRGETVRKTAKAAASRVVAEKPTKRKVRMSEEGRRRIAEAQKARWAARKAAQVQMHPVVAEDRADAEVARAPMPRHVKRSAKKG